MDDKIKQEFICTEKKRFRFKIGKILASGLSGFITGVIFAVIVCVVFFILYLRWHQ